jgi:peroxiredoxin
MKFWKFRRAAICLLVIFFAASAAGKAESAPAFNKLLIAPKGFTPPKDFSFPDLDGKIRKLSEMKGKVVLLAFFATWCPLCNEEMPKLSRLYEKFKGRGLVVLAVSIDRAPASFVRLWTEKKKLTYPVLHDQKYSVRRTHNVRFVPTIYVLDRDLQLAAWTIGQADWEGKKAVKLIERLLMAPSSTRAHSGKKAARLP